ncbi:MAG: (Fe-S)-binding protein [Deltaproteobacteria bacterium]|jgi:glycolate oxidase iron-sulfur subunit|nr:(Fe-S)-binding protein [Deltaproteobacteria bacterium]
MKDVNKLAGALMALDDKLISCMKCGLCQAVCPVFGATMLEADVTRGKIALLEKLAHKLIDDPEAVNEKLGRCLLCGSCQANCPSGVSIMHIFMQARHIVAAYLGLSPIKKLIFRTLLARPGLFNSLTRLGLPFQGLVMRKQNNAQGTVCAPLLSKLIGERHIPAPPAKPLHAIVGELDSLAGKSGIRVAFFPGCMGDKLYIGMAEACLKIFAHHGAGVYMPSGLACCGMPALASGDREGALMQIIANMDALKKTNFDYLVTPCGSCTAAVKEWWPELAVLAPMEYRAPICELAAKAMDINAFVIDVLKAEAAPQQSGARKVACHDPCHLKKSLGISSQPRAVVKLNPAYELVEMAEADRCCGCGGSFNLFHYDLSKKIGQRKRNNVVKSGAQTVVAGCPACMMQLTDMLAQNNDSVTVKHPVELYAEALR